MGPIERRLERRLGPVERRLERRLGPVERAQLTGRFREARGGGRRGIGRWLRDGRRLAGCGGPIHIHSGGCGGPRRPKALERRLGVECEAHLRHPAGLGVEREAHLRHLTNLLDHLGLEALELLLLLELLLPCLERGRPLTHMLDAIHLMRHLLAQLLLEALELPPTSMPARGPPRP